MTNPLDSVKPLMEPGWKIIEAFYGTKENLSGFNQSDFDAYKADLERYTKDLDDVSKESVRKVEELMHLAHDALTELGFKTDAYVDNPKSRSYPKKKMRVSLSSAIRPFAPIGHTSIGWPHTEKIRKAKRLIERTEKILKEREAYKAEQERQKAEDELATEAVAWLQGLGKKLGEDFTVSQAIQYANDLAFNEWSAEQAKTGEPIGFCGEDYCENCTGWIPGNHRCQCGNRRVSWTTYGSSHSFKTPGEGVYAEAY